MIGATLTTRLAQHGITKSAVTAFALTFLAYNFKFLWAPLVDNVRLPLLGRFGQRRSWLWLVGVLVMAAVAFLGSADPDESLYAGRGRRDHRRRRRRDLRHHHRRLSHRAARAAPARRRLGHVAIRLAHRLGGGRRARAGARGAHRLDRGLHRLRAVRAAGDAGRRGHGRAGAAPRAGQAARALGEALVAYFSPLVEFLQRAGRARRAALRADPQDRRHARQPDAAAAVRGPRLHQRRGRVLRHRRRLRRAADRHLRRRHAVRARWG